jgi:hypothetical protein
MEHIKNKTYSSVNLKLFLIKSANEQIPCSNIIFLFNKSF